ncbi:hypothetical protein H9P43_008935 [Blastocladiella emersonii ATCC 22665]|nr:hypothetical protein H9P43_008935 [Blastocladiella emersonii ATCC 22665]
MNRSAAESPLTSAVARMELQDPAGLQERYAFLCDYADPHAQLNREYILFFYPDDNSVEMFDLKSRRTFLRRTKYPSLALSDIVLGTAVTIFSRQLHVRDYADAFTRNKMDRALQRLHLLVPEDLPVGPIIAAFQGACTVQAMRRLPRHPMAGGKPAYLVHIVAVSGVRPSSGAVRTGSTATALAADLAEVQRRWDCVQVLDESTFDNQFHAPRPVDPPKRAAPSTLMIIKPHAVLEGRVGAVLAHVAASGFQIADLQSFVLSKPDAHDFLEIYKGVLPEYHLMVDEFTSGPLIAMYVRDTLPSQSTAELVGPADPVTALRELSGPYDPELAHVLHPNCLRAKFGRDKVKNAVHCTDLKEDAELEVQFFFQIVG